MKSETMKDWTRKEAEELYRKRDFSTLYADDYEGSIKWIRWAHKVDLYEAFADLICKVVKPKTLLDVGCGKGDFVAALRRRNVKAWGLDASDYIFNQGIAPEYLFLFDVLSDPWFFGEKSFDALCLIEVLEHFTEEDIGTVLDKICFTAKEYVCGTIPNNTTPSDHFLTKLRPWWDEQFRLRGFLPIDVGDIFLDLHPYFYKREKNDQFQFFGRHW